MNALDLTLTRKLHLKQIKEPWKTCIYMIFITTDIFFDMTKAMHGFQILYRHCSLTDLLGTFYELYAGFRKGWHRNSFVLSIRRLVEPFACS